MPKSNKTANRKSKFLSKTSCTSPKLKFQNFEHVIVLSMISPSSSSLKNSFAQVRQRRKSKIKCWTLNWLAPPHCRKCKWRTPKFCSCFAQVCPTFKKFCSSQIKPQIANQNFWLKLSVALPQVFFEIWDVASFCPRWNKVHWARKTICPRHKSRKSESKLSVSNFL